MILDKNVKLKWNSKNKKNYIGKGYLFTALGEEFEVNIIDLSLGSKIKVRVKCDYCSQEKEVMYLGYNRSLNDDGLYKCKSCANKGISEGRKNSYKDVKQEFKKRGYILLEEDYKTTHEIMKYICLKHKEKGALTIRYNNLKNGYGCPFCAKSKGELKVVEYLDKAKIKYEQEFIMNDCRGNRPLPFDFAIFDSKGKLACLIEYDGEHHYEPSRRFNVKTTLSKIKHNDNIKNIYCKENNIKFLRIPYWEYNNIESILSEFIKMLKI